MKKEREPCLCGDPECPRCFPFNRRDERDDGDRADERYERDRQDRIEREAEDKP